MNIIEATIMASEHYLTQPLPDNWNNMSDEDLDLFIETYTIDHAVGVPTGLIWEGITLIAEDFVAVGKLCIEAGKDARIRKLEDENRSLKSMCMEAANEIESHWASHCDNKGGGPDNLVSRLSGQLAPGLYHKHD